jgi:hypothetical protein
MPRNLNPWIERLYKRSEYLQEMILGYLEGLEQTNCVPTVKELRLGLANKKKKEQLKVQ